MVRLSVNVNKIATLRNSRGGKLPSVLEAVGACIAAGAPGVTVHPRADRRHITPDDVRQIAAALSKQSRRVEFNIEGDPRPELLALVEEVRPDQCTLCARRSWRSHEPGWLDARHSNGRPL
jgi:pyridoxine 5-phosphate synthase